MIAKVIVLINHQSVDRTFDYDVRDLDIQVGDLVSVQFGHQKQRGLVTEITEFSDFKELKPIIKKLDNIHLDSDDMKLLSFLKKKYFFHTAKVVDMMLNQSIIQRDRNPKIREVHYQLLTVQDAPKSQKFRLLQSELEIHSSQKYIMECGFTKSYLKGLLERGILREYELAVDFLSEFRNQKCSSESLSQLSLDSENYFYRNLSELNRKNKILEMAEHLFQRDQNGLILADSIYYVNDLKTYLEKAGIKVIDLSKLKKDQTLYHLDEIAKGNQIRLLAIGLKEVILGNLKGFNQIMIYNANSRYYYKNEISLFDLYDLLEFKRSRQTFSLLFIDSEYNFRLKYENNCLDLSDVKEPESIQYALIDLKNELIEFNNTSIISRYLDEKIKEAFKLKKKVLILCPQLGHSNFILCRECGQVIKCPTCNISMSYSKEKNQIYCRYCNRNQIFESICPNCGSSFIRYVGLGIEKVREVFEEKYGTVNIFTKELSTNFNSFIDLSTSYLLNLDRMSEYQFIALINSDFIFRPSNFNQMEIGFYEINRLKSLVLSNQMEELILQGYHFNESLVASLRGNFEGFYEQEIENREIGKYYPFYELMFISLKCNSYEESKKMSYKLFDSLIKLRQKELIILKPIYQNYEKNFRIGIKYTRQYDVHKLIQYLNKIAIDLKINLYYDLQN